MLNDQDIYIWFEFDKASILPEIKYMISLFDQASEENNSDEFVVNTNESLYLRMRTKFINHSFYSSLFTFGWQNINFRIFIEVRPNQEIQLISFGQPNLPFPVVVFANPDDPEDKDETYLLGLIVSSDIVIIHNILYFPKMMPLHLNTLFILSPKK